MIARAIAIILTVLTVSGCGQNDVKSENADVVHRQIGRFVLVAAKDGYPPMVLDTAAGCVMVLAKDASGQISIDEVSFPGGPSSCNAMKQLLVVDTLSRVTKQ